MKRSPTARNGGPHGQSAGKSTAAPRAVSRVASSPFVIRGWRAPFLLVAATLVLFTLTFPPAGAWPLAYCCLAPWIVGVCSMERTPRVFGFSYLLGVAFFAINAHWLMPVTPPGYAALCLVFGAAFPAVAWPVRHLHRRRAIPVTIALPIAWTAVEYLRGQTLVGFPWFYLAHSHYRVLPMIQVADLTGACGLSFVIAMVNGWIVDLLVQPFLLRAADSPARAARLPIGSLLAPVAVAATYLYGSYRLAESPRVTQPGPRVAILQQDQPLFVENSKLNDIPRGMAMEGYLTLARQAAVSKPDIIVMPEGAWALQLNREFVDAPRDTLENIRQAAYPKALGVSLGYMSSWQLEGRLVRDSIREFAEQSAATLVLGANTMQWRSDRIPERLDRFNSAFVFAPGSEQYIGRYDKIHLVLFGEFVPFRYTAWHSIYEWLNALTPWGKSGFEYSLSFGEAFHRFQAAAPSRDGRTFRFAIPICYEDTIARVIGEFVGRDRSEKQVDFLLNVSNDGWFNHSSELEQHLAASVFRAIEYRLPIARAVNTGVSVFVRTTGELHDRVRVSRQQEADFRAAESILEQMRAAAASAADRASPAADRAALGATWTLLDHDLPAALARLSLGYRDTLSTAAAAQSEAAPANASAPSATSSSPTDTAEVGRRDTAIVRAAYRDLRAALRTVLAATGMAERVAAWPGLAAAAASLQSIVPRDPAKKWSIDQVDRQLNALEETSAKIVAQIQSGSDADIDRASAAGAWQMVEGIAPHVDVLCDSAAATAKRSRRFAERLEHEYDFLRVRLVDRFAAVATARNEKLSPAWRVLSDQAAADAKMLARWRRQTDTAPGFRVAELQCDPRQTVYALWGDWFAVGCLSLTGLIMLDWTVFRARRPSRRQRRAMARAAAEAAEGS